MLRSMYSGVSGMKGFQTKMDVIANNIANVNTTSFKSSRATFQDMLSQTIASAQGPGAGANDLGGVNAQQIGLGVKVGSIDMMMNEGAMQPTNRELDFAIEGNGFFNLGNVASPLYTRDGAFFLDNAGNLVNSNGQNVLGYNLHEDTGVRTDFNLKALEIPNTIGDATASPSTLENLQSYTIDGTGTIKAVYSEGTQKYWGKVAVTSFTNPEGLEKRGSNNYEATNNSGTPVEGEAGTPGFGVIRQGFLEMSNVDLANEFTEMVIASRAYSANSRSITTSDEMLQELINLKR